MVQLGDPAESILRTQKSLHPDVIVMATHGRQASAASSCPAEARAASKAATEVGRLSSSAPQSRD